MDLGGGDEAKATSMIFDYNGFILLPNRTDNLGLRSKASACLSPGPPSDVAPADLQSACHGRD